MANASSAQGKQQDGRQGGLVRLGIDVGGTFTDLVLLRDGQMQTAKVLSTPSPEEGVFAALDKLGALQGELRVDLFCHGMTVATNALLERKGLPHPVFDHGGLPGCAVRCPSKPPPLCMT